MIFCRRPSKQQVTPGSFISLTILFLMVASASGATANVTTGSSAPLLSDNFAHDTQLNASLWQVSGTAAVNFSEANCPSCSLLTIVPGFSSSGMEIAQANASYEVGVIQSVASFEPPFTVSAGVEGSVSNGHPFVFGIASLNATSGVQITGNLNSRDCSSETNCADRATCGTPANPSIPANQCYYGIYGRIGGGGGTWSKTPALNSSPSTGVMYTLQISVDGAGNAYFNVSQGSQLLGSALGSVGVGPFYVMLAQSEGAPVPGPGPNQAYWSSVTLGTYVAPPPSPPTSSPTSSGVPPLDWIVIVIVAIAICLVVLLAARRRRDFVISVLDSASDAPVVGAGVWADGPNHYSGSTGTSGRVAFAGVKSGDYSVKTSAMGYSPSRPETVSVRGSTKFTARMTRSASGIPAPSQIPAALPEAIATAPPVPGAASPAVQPVLAGAPPQPASAPVPSVPQESDEAEGWGGPRIRHIIQTFEAKGALSPETALTADELGLSRIFVRIMKRRRGRTRVFVEIDGRYYLDQKALKELKQ